MLNYLFVALAASAALVGSITDFRGRWVPDYASYTLVFAGLLGHAAWSLWDVSIAPIMFSLIGCLSFAGVATALFYTGQFGGGDAKLLIGFGAILPLSINTNAPWPFLLALFFNILITGAVYSLIYLLARILLHRRAWFKEFIAQHFKYALFFVSIVILAVFPIIILLVFPQAFWLSLVTGIVLFAIYNLVLAAKAAEKTIFFKDIDPRKLEIGDFLLSYAYKNKVIGIEEKDIEKILKLCKAKGIKKLRIRDGIPYVPSFLLGLLASVAVGDLLWSIIALLRVF